MNTKREMKEEIELLAKRLYVARVEQRNIDGHHCGQFTYAPPTLEDCRLELGLKPLQVPPPTT